MYSVVIIDDEMGMHAVLKNLIQWEKLGLELYRECYNGDELLELLSVTMVDIIITDMQMPGLCGVELLKILHEKYKNLPILVISGYDDFKYTKQAIVSNAIDYILKPVDEDELNMAMIAAISKAKDNRLKYLENETDDKPISTIIVKYFSMIQEQDQNIKGVLKQNLAYQIRKYLDENYLNTITLAELESNFHVNKEQVSRLFKEVYKVSIFNYTDHLKIRKANILLGRGKSVKEVTYELGFYDESHFNKKYKKIMNIAPSDFSI